MPHHPGSIRSARMRLVGTGHGGPLETGSIGGDGRPATAPAGSPPSGPPVGSIYRPLIVGPAILHRLPASLDARRRWQVDVAPGGRFLPDCPSKALDVERVIAWRLRSGEPCRAGAALVSSSDLAGGGGAVPEGVRRDADEAFPAGMRFAGRDRGLKRGAAIEMYGWALMYQFPGVDNRAWVDPHETHDDLPAYYESPLELLDRAAFLAARGVRTRPIALITRRDDFIDTSHGPVNRFFPSVRFRQPVALRRLF